MEHSSDTGLEKIMIFFKNQNSFFLFKSDFFYLTRILFFKFVFSCQGFTKFFKLVS